MAVMETFHGQANLLGGVNATFVYLKPHEEQQWLKLAKFIFVMYENSLPYFFFFFLLLLVHFLLMSCQSSLRAAGAPACPAAEDTIPAVPVLLQIPAFGDVTAASGGCGRGNLCKWRHRQFLEVLIGSEMSALSGTAVSGNKARLRSV